MSSTCDYNKFWPAIIVEDFHTSELPASETLPDSWTVALGSFTTSSERYLEVTLPGEIVYTGTSPNNLSVFHEDANTNYVAVARFFGKEDLKLEIRGRRTDDDNYISLYVDFEDNVVELREAVGGTITDLASTSHTFEPDEIAYYSAELWMFDDNIYGVINESVIVDATTSEHITIDGYSLFVPEVNLDDPITIAKFAIHDLIERPAKELEGDPSNLIVRFRNHLQDILCEPPTRNYEEFVKHFKAYQRNRNMGRSNDTWRSIGYHIKKPSTEDYLVD